MHKVKQKKRCVTMKLQNILVFTFAFVAGGVSSETNVSEQNDELLLESVSTPIRRQQLGGAIIECTSDFNQLERQCFPLGENRYRYCPRGRALNEDSIVHGNVPRSCNDVYKRGYNASGVYVIRPTRFVSPFLVLCDMEIRGGGWTHIQKRYDGSQDFNPYYREFKFGFGDLAGEFWIGLENIFTITAASSTELLVELVDREGYTAYAHYTVFRIGSEKDGYALDVLGGYSGNAGDSLSNQKGCKFSTRDLDRDEKSNANCANEWECGWWQKNCYESCLNGVKFNPDGEQYSGIHWHTFKNNWYNIDKSRMLIRTR